jgi:CO/xanthine dehydrogenase Mo-binding subunit/aerobic-type carbon monoxide dehydrogenase small subunit (CoxS/CutS family)
MTRFVVNGDTRDVAAHPPRSLLHVLREELGLTGAKYGCGEGACGACTVLVDGAATRACVTPLAEVAGRRVTTVEGLSAGGVLHPVQRALVAEAAFQCAYCTPGMVMAAVPLLEGNADPTDDEMRSALDGNICRCGAYARILAAVRHAAKGDARPPAAATSPPEAAATSPPDDETPDVETPGGQLEHAPASPWDLAGDDEALFDRLGDGLLVVPDDAGAAWLHVGADGQNTVASGKVEVGQGSTAELIRLASEELRAPASSVRALLGDTDFTPYDAGTYGSLTTPEVVPDVRAAAATAREALLRIAADEWGTDVAALTANDACVTSADGTRSASYSELVSGMRRVEPVASDATLTPPDQWRLAGTRAPVTDGTDAVTGRRMYTTDLSLPDMLHGKVLRPPAFGATLRSVDTSAATAIPGVNVVRDGDFIGVVAPDPLVAADAVTRIHAEWDLASQPGNADLESHLRAHPVTVEGWDGGFRDETGDVDRALASAPVRLDATYTTAYIAHQPLETRAALAHWAGDRLTVWTGTQRPFGVREELAEALGIGEEQVRVIVPPTGGAYGGKHTGECALEAARLARAAGRPVKVRWTREEETTWGYFRPAAVIDIRSGARTDGTLTAWEFTNLNSGGRAIEPPYRVSNRRITYQPADSPLLQGSYRALSATANTFARESHVDELAHRLGVDPVEWRLHHLTDDRLAAVLQAAADRAGWMPDVHADAGGRGMGIACCVEKDSRVATCVEVRAAPGDPLEILRIVTAFECGAILDPANLANQVEGALVMGLGGALFEAIQFADGRVTSAAQSQYQVPRFHDLPPIEVVLLNRPDLPSAGAGETPIVALAPAIANAIFAACGVRLRSLPLVPDGRVPNPA